MVIEERKVSKKRKLIMFSFRKEDKLNDILNLFSSRKNLLRVHSSIRLNGRSTTPSMRDRHEWSRVHKNTTIKIMIMFTYLTGLYKSTT